MRRIDRDDSRIGEPGGEASKETSLGAVPVDDVETLFFDEAVEIPKGLCIVERVDGALHPNFINVDSASRDVLEIFREARIGSDGRIHQGKIEGCRI
jgi:hypothetical protein